ncbi:hypothetical protein C0J56_13895 [Pseudomonas fluorescens]|nr:hypothetical protein C0J56_13895 [Pseudomonas fluorescens]
MCLRASEPARDRSQHLPRKILWERACSRRRRHGQHHCKLTHRFREQARSHTGFVSVPGWVFDTDSLWERALSAPALSGPGRRPGSDNPYNPARHPGRTSLRQGCSGPYPV